MTKVSSIKAYVDQHTSFVVFEPNNAMTWIKVKAIIYGYLYRLWDAGEVAGVSPEQAFIIQVGLGKSMTSDDILEGRMIINVGIAASKPAEFTFFTITHRAQRA